MKNRMINKVGMLLLAAAMIFASCSDDNDGRLHLEANAQTVVGKKLVENTNLIATISSDVTSTLADGVTATEIEYFSMTGYAMHAFIFEVDLSNSNISLEVSTPYNKNTPAFQQMTVQATYEDAEGHKVWGGVNGAFCNTTTAMPYGVLYKDGALISTSNSDAYPNFFAVTKEKTGLIANMDTYATVKGDIQEAVGGGVMLVRNGLAINQTDVTINPRTCIGVSSDKKHIYILVVDGRNYHYSNGMMYSELAQCMLALGAETAMNLDGGGSSTFFIRNTPDFTEGRFVVRNWPSDNGGMQRGVGPGLIIVSKK